ncbi:MAG: hypothetical protein UT16_C0014G0009 [Candidatus Azambacteria bacterium GW2011_GWA2_39_10]|uniref:Uncharacterized protein n=1 Tax=Candidatus Azambacteria bacterium GW2011_GWA2_39_10 TaxID=1618611 RepID=A0A0G0LHT4_9BACT|nr:MAG: hypothetical protein UT16_C0014G0009 [Candidatus Azambacteria bacterium GW2011_GWA2_39_10]
MIQAMFFDNNAVDEVLNFYLTHARNEILYPKNPGWITDHLGADFFLMGIRIDGELVAVAWVAQLKDFVYFTIENEALLIHNDGPYAYSGGWCIRPDCRNKGLFQLLTATVNLFWFTKINRDSDVILWGRMVGQKDINGNPLFWDRVGEPITGLSYQNLLELPFGTMEEAIFTRWPKKPTPFQNIPQGILEQTSGKTYEPLVAALNQFLKWGWVALTDRYVPTSLNRFFWSKKDNIKNPQEFFDQALSKTLKSLGS